VDTAAALFQVVGALRQAQHCDGHVLQAEGIAEALQRIVPAEEATLNEHDTRHQQSELVELSDKELDSVAGGEIHITKTIDQASPVLFVACCTGKHFQS